MSLCILFLNLHSTAQAGAPSSSSTNLFSTVINTTVSIDTLSATTSESIYSLSRLRKSILDKYDTIYDSSFLRTDDQRALTRPYSTTTISSQMDGSLSNPKTEYSSALSSSSILRDLWAGSSSSNLIYLADSTKMSYNNGTMLISNTPLPGAVWLAVVGIGVVGLPRLRRRSIQP